MPPVSCILRGLGDGDGEYSVRDQRRRDHTRAYERSCGVMLLQPHFDRSAMQSFGIKRILRGSSVIPRPCDRDRLGGWNERDWIPSILPQRSRIKPET